MFKKTLALLAATVTLAVGMGTVALAANCADDAHNWSKISETAATCTTDGSATYVCATNGCNASKTEVIPAKGHSNVLVNKTESTCKDPGIVTYECKVCYASVTEKLPLAAHTWVESAAEAPTCELPGVTAGKVCKVCHYAEKTPETVPATGHQWTAYEVLVAPTCEMKGVEVRTCTACGVKENKDIAKLGHTPVVVPGKPATCEAAGITDGSACAVCRKVLTVGTELPKLAHVETIIPPVDATCISNAVTAGKKCTICGKVTVKPTEVPDSKANHKWVDDAIITKQTCIEDGEKARHCETCGKTQRVTIPADGVSHHIVVIEEECIAATCQNPGRKVSWCEICGDHDTLRVEVLPQLDHLFQPKVRSEVSCTQNGVTVYECAYCKTLKTDAAGNTVKDIVPKINHKYAIEQKAVAATCTTEGTDGYWYCPDCKKYAYFAGGGFVNDVPNTTPATGHKMTDKKNPDGKYTVVDATCVSPKKIVYHCLNKDCLYTEVWVDDENGPDENAHDYKNVPAKDPTCTEEGWKAYEACALCQKVNPAAKKKVIPALGHDWTVVAGKAATCTEAGKSEAHKCTRCDATVGGQTVPALGHNYVVDEKLSNATITVEICTVCKDIKYTEHDGSCKHNWVVLKGTPATCTSAGVSDGKKCTICGEVQGYEKLPRLEHKPYYVPAEAPTCTKDGHSALYACEYCYKALTEYDVYMSNGQHTPVYGYDNDVHYMACKVCGEILLSGDHELVTTVSGGKVHTACKWCAYSKESSIFGK